MEKEKFIQQQEKGTHFNLVSFENFESLKNAEFSHEKVPFTVSGKIFLKELLELTGTEISVNVLPPFQSLPFHHKHRYNEEVFICIKGTGQIQLDGTSWDIHEGSFVRMAPGAIRTWRNTGHEPLIFMVIQAQEHSLTSAMISDGVPVQEPVLWENQ